MFRMVMMYYYLYVLSMIWLFSGCQTYMMLFGEDDNATPETMFMDKLLLKTGLKLEFIRSKANILKKKKLFEKLLPCELIKNAPLSQNKIALSRKVLLFELCSISIPLI